MGKMAIALVVALVCTAAIAGFVWLHSQNEPPTKQQTATTIGKNSPAVNMSAKTSGSNSPVTLVAPGGVYNNAAVDPKAIAEAVVRELQKTSEEKGDELRKQYPFGYAIFAITQTKEIVPLQFQNRPVTADWKNSYTEMTRDEITLNLTNIETPFASIGTITVSIAREDGATQGLISDGKEDLVVALVKSGEYSDVLVLGVRQAGTGRNAPLGDRRYHSQWTNLKFH